MTAGNAIPEPGGKNASALKTVAVAWFAEIGRAPVEGEAAEFKHAFEGADPALLRRALDEYVLANGQFPKLAGLRAAYQRLMEAVAAKLEAAAAERKANAPRAFWTGPQLTPEEIKAAIREGGWKP